MAVKGAAVKDSAGHGSGGAGVDGRGPWLAHLLLIAVILLLSAPMIFAVIKATQPSAEVMSSSLRPGGEFLNNLGKVWTQANLGQYMLNSAVVAVAVTAGKTVVSLLAALAFVFFRFPLRGLMFALVLLSLMLPTEVLIVALFDFVSKDLGWANTYQAIIVPFLASATGTFLFRQHFMNIPRSLSEAARIDGCGPLEFLTRILLPMSLNTIAGLAVIQFVFAWDQYIWPLVIMQNDERQVVQVGLRRLIDTGGQTDWGAVMAGALITLVPPLLVFLVFQRAFSQGVALNQEK